MSTLRFSANLGFLWKDRPLPARIEAAAAAGFHAVECHQPYDTDPAEIRAVLGATGLAMLSLNTPAGDPEAGGFGLAAVPGWEAECRAGVCESVDYANAIGARNVHVMAGVCEEGRVALHQMYDNLAWAAEVAKAASVGILIEPINRTDRPGYALYRVSQAIDLIHRLETQEGVDNVRILFDCYHAQMTEGNLLARITEALPWLGHMQVASVPGRHEPVDCEIDYDWLFRHIADLGYDGWIGAEYNPRGEPEDSFDWYMPWKPATAPAPLASPLLYRHFDRTALDAEYNNREKVADFPEWLERCQRRSAESREAFAGNLDIAFGPSGAETLDIFYSGRQGKPGDAMPIHVFLHGGYWQALSKDEFSYVANATRGTDALCVVVNYALVPDVTMDGLVDQCRRALAWLWHHAAEYGGDPTRITVSGHSAGGHLVAMLAATDWPAVDPDCPTGLVRHGLSISGLLDLEPIRLCYLNDVLGMDAETARRLSPVTLANRGGTTLHCVFGELEGEEYRRQSESLAARWDLATAESLEGHDHFSIASLLDDPESALSGMLRGMLAR